MFNHFRFLSIALLTGLFLTACGNNDNADQAEVTSSEPAAVTETIVTDDAQQAAASNEDNPIIGMTEEEAIAKWGEPSLTQSNNLDALKVIHHEWNTEDGTIAVQFHNGVAKFSQTLTAE